MNKISVKEVEELIKKQHSIHKSIQEHYNAIDKLEIEEKAIVDQLQEIDSDAVKVYDQKEWEIQRDKGMVQMYKELEKRRNEQSDKN